MKKPIKLDMPKCSKCKRLLEPQFTTELERDSDEKPKVIILFGKCKKCKVITVCNLIEVEDIPQGEDVNDLK